MTAVKTGLGRAILLLALLGVWEGLAKWVLNPFWIGQPSLIIVSLATGIADGSLLVHSVITCWEALVGLALGAAIGIPIGIGLYRYRTAAMIVDPFFMALYSLPRIALAPLFILWFGIDLFSKVMLVCSLVLFVFTFNVVEGLKGVDRDLYDALTTMRASPAYMLRHLLLPAIVPWLLTALRLGIGLALVGAIVGELIGASRGLGWHLNYAASQLDTTGVFADLILLMLIATGANELVAQLERRVLAWRIR